MPSLSVAMIVKNESYHLAACLDSVKDWVDEIIILDSGSTDDTPIIAEKYGAKFYQNTNWPGFGKQRQLAQSYISSDYVLWLDADERITPTLKKSILEAIQADKDNVIYQLPRLSEVFGKKIYHSGWYPDYVRRLYRTQTTRYNDNLVHESVIIPEGFNVISLKGDIEHITYTSLHQYLVKSANYAKAWAEQRHEQHKRTTLFQAVTHAIATFGKMYILKAGFLDGRHGFLLAVLSAHSTFIKYADLWLRNQNNTNQS